MNEVRPNSIQFCHRQTWLGIVLMVREAVAAQSPGDWEYGKWRKAKYYDIPKMKETKCT